MLSLATLAALAALASRHRSHRHGARDRGLVDKGLVDVGDDTTTSNGGTDEGIKLLISTDGKQQVTGRDTLHLKILASVSGKLQHLSSQVLHNGRSVDSGGGTNTLLRVDASLQETVNTTHRELQAGLRRAARALDVRRDAQESSVAVGNIAVCVVVCDAVCECTQHEADACIAKVMAHPTCSW